MYIHRKYIYTQYIFINILYIYSVYIVEMYMTHVTIIQLHLQACLRWTWRLELWQLIEGLEGRAQGPEFALRVPWDETEVEEPEKRDLLPLIRCFAWCQDPDPPYLVILTNTPLTSPSLLLGESQNWGLVEMSSRCAGGPWSMVLKFHRDMGLFAGGYSYLSIQNMHEHVSWSIERD